MRDQLPEPTGSPAEVLAVRYSHPLWLVEAFQTLFGSAGAEALLKENNRRPELTARVNPLQTSVEATLRSLQEQGVDAEAHPWLADCICLSGAGDLEALDAFREGWITIQDPASQLAALVTGAESGQKVLDVCSAPGGKAFVIAQMMEDTGELWACDIHPHKIQLIENGARRLKLSCVRALVRDAAEEHPAQHGAFHAVLADVTVLRIGHHPQEAGYPLQKGGGDQRASRAAGEHSPQRRQGRAARRKPGLTPPVRFFPRKTGRWWTLF